MQHAPRDAYLDHPRRRVGEPVGERILQLPRVEESIAVGADRWIDRAVPPDAPTIRYHHE